jgi:hypothetical protein
MSGLKLMVLGVSPLIPWQGASQHSRLCCESRGIAVWAVSHGLAGVLRAKIETWGIQGQLGTFFRKMGKIVAQVGKWMKSEG